MTVDKPDGQELKRLTNAIMKSGRAEKSKELIKVADSISARSTLKSVDVDAAHIERISSFYGGLEAINTADALKQRFARDIRRGAMDYGERATLTHDILKSHARARLDISNPDYEDG
jgi:hypothetical protein